MFDFLRNNSKESGLSIDPNSLPEIKVLHRLQSNSNDAEVPGVIEETIVSSNTTVNSDEPVNVQPQATQPQSVDPNANPASDNVASTTPQEPKSTEQELPKNLPVQPNTSSPSMQIPQSADDIVVPEEKPAVEEKPVVEEQPTVTPSPLGADENAKLAGNEGLPGDVANPVPVVSSEPATTDGKKPDIDIEKLQQMTQDQLAQRPDQSSAATPASTTDGEDPLKKLLGMVQDKEGKVDPIKVKRSFVVVKSKVSNDILRSLVEEFRKEGVGDIDILEYLLKLDKMTEEGEINEDYFLSYQQE